MSTNILTTNYKWNDWINIDHNIHNASNYTCTGTGDMYFSSLVGDNKSIENKKNQQANFSQVWQQEFHISAIPSQYIFAEVRTTFLFDYSCDFKRRLEKLWPRWRNLSHVQVKWRFVKCDLNHAVWTHLIQSSCYLSLHSSHTL